MSPSETPVSGGASTIKLTPSQPNLHRSTGVYTVYRDKTLKHGLNQNKSC